ncbi:proline-, glutamic acid- and leucine-rich protein 1-like [Hemicordylus capensis]|uniref:proline-, glutamic acid- and leucine-rich protein 1-like n=1 Tax=Hemicordylus capensis TaxID=884348 RepID=UPI00230499A4|nr:proline-, glutamic acid- and leucine-rich protein 1-like [Hemicordylus capensis]
MAERMRGCESPEMPAEGGAPCQMPPGGREPHHPAASDGAGPNADQEMQWVSAREEEEESLPGAPALHSQLFLRPPQGLGAEAFFRGPPAEPCEEMSRDPAELPGQAAGTGGGGGGPPCPGPCEGRCRDFYGGEPWPGKARLPSIVVEPSEGDDDVESGELRWPPDEFSLLEEEEEEEEEDDDLFAEGLSSFESDLEEVLL